MFDLSRYWPINQSYVTVMLNKRPYTNNIAVFDMFTGKNHSYSSQHIQLFSGPRRYSLKLLSMKRCDIFSTR